MEGFDPVAMPAFRTPATCPPGARAAPDRTPAQRAPRRSARFLRWLRKIHLYVGLWGAALGFLFGATGILLNHRAVLNLPVEKVVQKSTQFPLPDPALRSFKTPEDMARWLQAELKFEGLQTRLLEGEHGWGRFGKGVRPGAREPVILGAATALAFPPAFRSAAQPSTRCGAVRACVV